MNIMLLSYDEIIEILSHPDHYDYNYICPAFGDLEENCKDDDGNYMIAFSENCIEVNPGDYVLIDVKNDYWQLIHNLDNLTDKVNKLLKDSHEYEE